MIFKENIEVVSLQLPTKKRYKKNLVKLIELLKKHKTKKLILTPEVFLTGYDYENILTASKFSAKAIKILKKIVDNQILVITVILETKTGFINQAVVIHKHKVIYRQNKAKLFKLGDEHLFLEAGDTENIKPFEINGVSYAILICFELRFKDLWRKIEGVDVVLIPARWGLARKSHLEILSNALAVMNQAFVVVSNSSDKDMASSSGVISPFGEQIRDDENVSISGVIDFQEIKKMRRYIVLD
ncbi:Aliphatic amidase AmiE [hydrothermal vent metagenome]|uniref:Aliphatic amidase AmiE n=1 Tax=hydrothermal vent metagenome TaxID=652676 RepID=A0A1W1CGT2_9ZZZZ